MRVYCTVVVFFLGFFSSSACDPNDLSFLRAFAALLENRIDGWELNATRCCDWVGVSCDDSSSSSSVSFDRVVSLELGGRRLSGSISESLGGLDHLRVLNLSRNSLQGSVSGLITHFPELVVLDLSMNSFSGTLAGGSLDLPAMEVFNVSGNKIAGAVPVGLCINSTRISVLDLGGNLFGGVLPPEIGNCVSLEMLDLATNFISGGLPESLFRLVNLKELYLQENRFSGELSGLIGGLSNLTHLDLSSNNFSGSIPDVFDRFFHLSYFSAQSNRLTGAIPPSLANSPTVSFLILRNNSLSGTIDLNCSAMVNLVSLNLATNQFHGDIPETLASCPLLRTINFARIDFSGQVPESFKNFQSLSSISLSNASISNLTGALEIFQHCRNLTTLVLTLNFRNEEMPSYQSLQFSELKILVIANCQITGVIPRWLSGCRNLQLLDLSMNRLSGAIPPWFGNLSSLFYLDVSDNMLSGEIPKELTEIQRLIDGNASMDGPSPDFPFFVRRNLTGFKYRHVLSFPSTLELANNSFTGNIWPEFGKLKELQVLDLKYNRLSGSIPSSLSEMRSLETLDLSFNNLAGRIPSSLTSLSFLSEFDVAYNNLSGPVPTGGQFSTFPNSSFVGNLALCGDHGLPPCPRLDKAPLSPPGKSEKRKGAVIAMGVGIGLGSSVLAGIAICLVMARACFSRGEQQKDDDDDLSRDPDVEEISSVAVLCQDKDAVTEICFDDLLKATDNFDQSNIIGCGGFGFVYKAVLPDGRKVAIKRLCGEHFQMEKEFHAEIETLSRAQHPNLVRLQGYCKYRDDRLLIYTFMENGSLDYWLHEKSDGPASLDWKTRLEIARGAARGLSYLHLRCEPRILHRDVKSSNILLGERFEARLADFGLARLINPFNTHVTTDLVGTLGYIPPEYVQASVATYKGDIYSFGVVLLELLTGKRPMDICRPKGCRNLVEWIGGMIEEKRESEVFDPFIKDGGDEREMVRVLEIAWGCLNENPKLRPSIEELSSWLETLHSSSSPPSPTFH